MIADFLKDIYYEVNGYDLEEINNKKMIKLEKEKRERIILKKDTKIIFTFFYVFLFCTTIMGCYIAKAIGSEAELIKYILAAIIDVTGIVCIWIKRKETEVASLITLGLNFIIYFVPVF